MLRGCELTDRQAGKADPAPQKVDPDRFLEVAESIFLPSGSIEAAVSWPRGIRSKTFSQAENPVTPIASPTTSFERNSEFDSFLFAPIGEERNGMALSVLSAIARLDVDPWHEAANLQGMPARAATERLTLLISSLPNVQPMPLAPATIARLIGLLPQKPRDEIWLREAPFRGEAARRWPLVLYFIFAIITICAEHTANQPDAKAPAGSGSAPSASVVDPVAVKARGE